MTHMMDESQPEGHTPDDLLVYPPVQLEDTPHDTEPQEPMMDDIWTAGIEQEAAERAEKEMLPPDGNYETQPPWVVDGKQFEAKDGMPARKVFTAYGEATHVKLGQSERLRIRFSPDLQKRDDGKYDGASKNYITLAKVYRAMYEVDETVSAGRIKEMLENFSLGIYGRRFDGDEGPMFYIANIYKLKRG